MVNAGKEIAKDIKILVDRLFKETSVDGIYYSVQSVQDVYFDHEKHKELVEPLDLDVLNYINELNENIILHICGYGHYTNNLEWYKDYPAKVYNWATHTEDIDLKEGQRIFKNKSLLGGFDNNADSILYKGDEDELRNEVYSILEKTGTRGIAIGADCTISENIDVNRIKLIQKFSSEFSEK